MSCSVTLFFGVVSVERDTEKTEFACVGSFSLKYRPQHLSRYLPVQVTTKPFKVLVSRIGLTCSLIRLTFGSSVAGCVSGQICAAMTDAAFSSCWCTVCLIPGNVCICFHSLAA